MAIEFHCKHCNQTIAVDVKEAGRDTDCPKCGREVVIPAETPDETPTAVIVTDIDMPFWSMVTFMFKWAIASIPALIALAFVGLVVSGLFTTAISFLASPR
ncbi:MAG: hypothetical protein WA117_16770 [Verrucomicrobiia bacterium]